MEVVRCLLKALKKSKNPMQKMYITNAINLLRDGDIYTAKEYIEKAILADLDHMNLPLEDAYSMILQML